ncbi:hypothetical protein JHK82_046236 [Glycine max]|uniref:Uncharacterized protein n=1 Tax=Glycine max TaxID=3847 RepID=A0A0R0F6D6_SOYBN|nr:hypothetical protein JHK86_046135 [Glycine max]KAG4942035.1 hypothetical protein JHK85_046681 [Glycine max]KAG5096382.1 hypothetical protein JHK82_046236 [Glycine max]
MYARWRKKCRNRVYEETPTDGRNTEMNVLYLRSDKLLWISGCEKQSKCQTKRKEVRGRKHIKCQGMIMLVNICVLI